MRITVAMRVVLAALVGVTTSCEAQDPLSATSLSMARAERGGNAGRAEKPTIVLVHGAWADATGWQDLIPLLQKDGYKVVASQNPLTSFADDAATTRRLIEGQAGPVVVVGHSYGGAIMTSAAAGNPNVKALVYVAAFGPEIGEVFGGLLHRFGASDIDAALVPDAAGYVTIDAAKYRPVFAGDLPERETRVMAVTQKPLNSAILGQSLDRAAWKTIPSWYIVAQDDHTIKPELQRFMAQRMGARVSELKSAHLVFISRAKDVAKVVVEAAQAPAR